MIWKTSPSLPSPVWCFFLLFLLLYATGWDFFLSLSLSRCADWTLLDYCAKGFAVFFVIVSSVGVFILPSGNFISSHLSALKQSVRSFSNRAILRGYAGIRRNQTSRSIFVYHPLWNDPWMRRLLMYIEHGCDQNDQVSIRLCFFQWLHENFSWYWLNHSSFSLSRSLCFSSSPSPVYVYLQNGWNPFSFSSSLLQHFRFQPLPTRQTNKVEWNFQFFSLASASVSFAEE